MSRAALADSTGTSLTYGEALLRATALGSFVSRTVGRSRYVGVMIPPTAHAAVANVGLALFGKIPVNLNYSASERVVNSSIEQCSISHVLTSRRALDKFKIQPKAELLFLEDLPKRVTRVDKVRAFAATKLPEFTLQAFLPGLRGNKREETATVIFTSGSTAEPKGVLLTHRNVLSNMLGIKVHAQLRDDDVVLGILPFFHSFGFTVTLWTALGLGLKAAYHFSPLDSKIVGHMCAEHRATLMAATPTFMRGYLQRCPPEQFESLRLLIVGAEKLKPDLSAQISSVLKVQPMEGYGCTETGPVVSVNVPFDVTLEDGRVVAGNRPGTVGRLLPGTEARAVDVESGKSLPPGEEGIIQVKGPQVMAGYLNNPEATANVLREGWYATGDLGTIDSDGFLKITGRLSRFAKIGGEMVPHHAVETAIALAAAVEESTLAVTSLPDAKRGERLVVLFTDMPMNARELCRKLQQSDLPRLWIPSADDFVKVDTLPTLGTGKLDLVAIRTLAEQGLSQSAQATGDPITVNSPTA
jgi:acyl-[acyl-carrier-protein]-phospholipid O-acyltransferase/long-chain-fatty-acid--[acyl-carrier-protein] ligase